MCDLYLPTGNHGSGSIFGAVSDMTESEAGYSLSQDDNNISYSRSNRSGQRSREQPPRHDNEHEHEHHLDAHGDMMTDVEDNDAELEMHEAPRVRKMTAHSHSPLAAIQESTGITTAESFSTCDMRHLVEQDVSATNISEQAVFAQAGFAQAQAVLIAASAEEEQKLRQLRMSFFQHPVDAAAGETYLYDRNISHMHNGGLACAPQALENASNADLVILSSPAAQNKLQLQRQSEIITDQKDTFKNKEGRNANDPAEGTSCAITVDAQPHAASKEKEQVIQFASEEEAASLQRSQAGFSYRRKTMQSRRYTDCNSSSEEGAAVSFPEVRPKHFPAVDEYYNRKEKPEIYPPDDAGAGAGTGNVLLAAGSDDASATLCRDYFNPRGLGRFKPPAIANLLRGRNRRSDNSCMVQPLPEGNARIEEDMATAEESGKMGIQYVNMKLELATLSQELEDTRLKLQHKATQPYQHRECAKQMEEQDNLSVESFLQIKKSSDGTQVSLEELQKIAHTLLHERENLHASANTAEIALKKTTRDLVLSQTIAEQTEKRLGAVTKERDVSVEQLQEAVAERSGLDMKLKDAMRVIQMMKNQAMSSSMERNGLWKQSKRAEFDQTQIQMVAQNRANTVNQLEIQVKQLKTELKEEKFQRWSAEREPARLSASSARNNSGNHHQDDPASTSPGEVTSVRRIKFSWIANVLFPPSRRRRFPDSTRVKRSASDNDLAISIATADADADDRRGKSFKMGGRSASYDNLIQNVDSSTAKGKSIKRVLQRGSPSTSTKSLNPFQNMSRSIQDRYSGSTRSDMYIPPDFCGSYGSSNTDANQQNRCDQEELNECEVGDRSNEDVQHMPLRPNYLLDAIARSFSLPFHRNKKKNSSRHNDRDYGDNSRRSSTSSYEDGLEREDYSNAGTATT
jgi:hypothetical protein